MNRVISSNEKDKKTSMNVSRPRIDVKMRRINIKTSRESSKSSISSRSSGQTSIELSKIDSNLSSTTTDQIFDEMNDSNSKYFESSETLTSILTNKIVNLNSTTKAFKTFDDSIEKIDFVPKKIDFAKEKAAQFLSNIASKTAKETTPKRKANKSLI